MNKKISFGKIALSISGSAASGSETVTANQSENVISDVGGFGVFGAINEAHIDSQQENDGMVASMGFSDFGKKARTFDIETLVSDTRKAAVERNRDNLANMRLDHILNILPHSEFESKEDESDEDEFVGPPLPPSMNAGGSRLASSTIHSDIGNDSNSDDKGDPEELDSDPEDENPHRLPLSHELILGHGSKSVSAVAADPSGARLVTGGLDYEVRFWDFHGMDAAREPFRAFVPYDGYPIYAVEYSCTGDKVLVVTGSHQAKIYDRDGIQILECSKGDMYLHDMAKTKGHVSSLTCGTWNPKDKEEFVTAAQDGTCRMWNVASGGKQKNVVKARASSGLKTKPTAVAYSRDGLTLACACDDGSIQMWDTRKNFVNTCAHFRSAHTKGTETSSLSFAYDNRLFATRGGDDTLKLWDIRNNKKCIHEASNLFNRFPMTDCLFSPNDKLVVTGTSLEKGEGATGKLVMFDRDTWQVAHSREIGPCHVLRIVWHPRLNQIMMGCGDGKVRLLYDPDLSHNGAVLVAGKKHQRSRATEVVLSQHVLIPHSLPMYRADRHRSAKKTGLKDRQDPVKSHQPDLPIGNAGTGGRVASGGSTLSSFIIRNLGLKNKALDEGDPREALLKYAKAASEDPYWVSPAYAKTQPNTLFTLEEEGGEGSNKKQKTS